MRRSRSLILFLACSLWLPACGHNGPKVTVCLVRGKDLSDEAAQNRFTDAYANANFTLPDAARPSPAPSPLPKGCDCYDERTQKGFFLPIEQCDKYVALPPQDAQTVFNYCKMGNQ